MAETEINKQIEANVFKGVSISTAMFALIALFYGELLTTLTAVLFAALLWLLNRHVFKAKKDKLAKVLTHCLVFALGATTAVSAVIPGGFAIYWIYAFPVLTFFLYPTKAATSIAIIYSALMTVLITGFYQGPEKIQLVINYMFCLVLTGAFVYLREEREKQLKPLRRTDNLTLASTREHLADDLNREIIRSEREGTSVSMLALSIDPEFMITLSDREAEQMLQKLGRLLHESLRPFDSYYRYEQAQFLITLPLTPTGEAMKLAENLRLQSKKRLGPADSGLTVSIGVAGLNVGDNAQTLTEKAIAALRRAQQSGKNRTVKYSDSDSALSKKGDAKND